MTSTAENFFTENYRQLSTLEALQIRLIGGDILSAEDLLSAVSTDIKHGSMLNQTILIKICQSPKLKLSTLNYQRIAIVLRDALISIPVNESERFINYAQCAAACMKHAAL